MENGRSLLHFYSRQLFHLFQEAYEKNPWLQSSDFKYLQQPIIVWVYCSI